MLTLKHSTLVLLLGLLAIEFSAIGKEFFSDGDSQFRDEVFQMIKKEEDNGRGHGSEMFHQLFSSSHCDAWVDAIRDKLENLRVPLGYKASLYDVITDWDGSGGRHNLYIGLILHNRSVTVFTIDPWQASREAQFRVLKPVSPNRGPSPDSRLYTSWQLGTAFITYDPVLKVIYYSKPPEGIPEFSAKLGDEIGARIDLANINGEKIKRPEPILAAARGSRSARASIPPSVYLRVGREKQLEASSGNYKAK